MRYGIIPQIMLPASKFDDAYKSLAHTIEDNLTGLVASLGLLRRVKNSIDAAVAEAFFPAFLIHADLFASECCEHLAVWMRSTSSTPLIRRSPPWHLAGEIRQACFPELDGILLRYPALLRSLNVDVVAMAGRLSGASIKEAALQQAAAGFVVANYGGGRFFPTFRGLWAASDEAVHSGNFDDLVVTAFHEARQTSLRTIADYLRTITSLLPNLLSFCVSQCLGPTVVSQRLNEALQSLLLVSFEGLRSTELKIRSLPIFGFRTIAVEKHDGAGLSGAQTGRLTP